MAAPQGQLPVARYLGALAGVLAILYALAFLTGSTHTPKMGLDLQGGMHLALEVDDSKGVVADKSEAIDRALKNDGMEKGRIGK